MSENPDIAAVEKLMDAECYSHPIFELVDFHDGRSGVGWHGGPGWYWTPKGDYGVYGPFKTFDDAMEHAEKDMWEE